MRVFRIALFVLPLLSIITIAACTTATAPKSLTIQQIVDQSTARMSAVTSVHFRLEMTGGSISIAPGIALDALDGDAAVPDRWHIQAKATLFGMVVDVELISAEGQQFLRNPVSQQWQQLPVTLSVGQLLSPNSGAASIISSAKQLTQEASEAIDGNDCYHIRGTVDAANIATVIGGKAANTIVPVEAWIDSTDFAIRQIVLRGAILQDDPANIVRLLKLSQFNSPVTIQLPG
jgi:hypothetical protein